MTESPAKSTENTLRAASTFMHAPRGSMIRMTRFPHPRTRTLQGTSCAMRRNLEQLACRITGVVRRPTRPQSVDTSRRRTRNSSAEPFPLAADGDHADLAEQGAAPECPDEQHL